jgi:flagellar biosynthesis/type III secretory pathway chaperone
VVDQLLADIVPVLEEEHAACQELIALLEEQRRCLIQGDAAGLNDAVTQGQKVTARLEDAERQCFELLRQHGYEETNNVALSALLTQASEPLRSRCEQLRQSLCATGLYLRAGMETNMRLMEQSLQLTECLVSALTHAQRPDGYVSNGAPPTASGVSVVVDSQA